ncbi:unnamed protein product [Lampetra planeri]
MPPRRELSGVIKCTRFHRQRGGVSPRRWAGPARNGRGLQSEEGGAWRLPEVRGDVTRIGSGWVVMSERVASARRR